LFGTAITAFQKSLGLVFVIFATLKPEN